MATSNSAVRSSPPEHRLPGLDLDVQLDNLFASALLSRSGDICHQETPQAISGPEVSDDGTDINPQKDLNTLAHSSDLLYGSPASSSMTQTKSRTPHHSSQETIRSLPGSPFSMTDSFASSSAGPPPSTACSLSSIRVIPSTTSSFLRPGSRFEGTQQSDKQTYIVNVEIKHVDMRESFMCGHLCIQGLTPDNPTLTTYFEGEMIGSRYGFRTKNESWGAKERDDIQHWGRFPAYRPHSSNSKDSTTKEFGDQEQIFMRWKEYFLVPNHRVKELTGASFDGFYYICFSQTNGNVSGIYFHSNSEKWQQLELKHIPDHGIYKSVEFR
ncbi:hypothetical protein DRE_01350 [Drechslerella stenobrocha 248]|uniref:Vesicle-mediated transport protein Vid24 n=1 Tax=Drechslerella stenobrocha 248 TaxID=1043628 RepID=W7HVU8_9PEZI|nr:hypothetical protein DRE_01350 [Drechslerella stenobrocha 248]